MKQMIAILLALSLLLGISASLAEGQGSPGGRGGNGGGRGGNGRMHGGAGGGVDKSSDTELQTMINEIVPKYQLLTYDDAETGTSLQYYLYVPENYHETEYYPMIQFIPDSSVVGKDASAYLTQGWGGLIWATDEEQAKHPSFVVLPIFTETIVDDNFNHSAQIDVAMRLLRYLTETYSIDTNRIYTTGQSMGGMTSFHLSIAYPEFFAAYLFVGSQWDTTQLSGLEEKPFFYIVSAGDPKASAGQRALLAVFDSDNAACSHDEWGAQDDADSQNSNVAAMLAEGNSANFVTFTAATTLAEGQTAMSGAGEHMTSFDYAYKLEAVRDWLFEQHQ